MHLHRPRWVLALPHRFRPSKVLLPRVTIGAAAAMTGAHSNPTSHSPASPKGQFPLAALAHTSGLMPAALSRISGLLATLSRVLGPPLTMWPHSTTPNLSLTSQAVEGHFASQQPPHLEALATRCLPVVRVEQITLFTAISANRLMPSGKTHNHGNGIDRLSRKGAEVFTLQQRIMQLHCRIHHLHRRLKECYSHSLIGIRATDSSNPCRAVPSHMHGPFVWQ